MTAAERTATVLSDIHAEPLVPHCAIAVLRELAKSVAAV